MLLTGLILIILSILSLWKVRFVEFSNPFSKDNMNIIKGIAAIIVVMVHFPDQYGNSLQNAIGSFAYISVTIFFMASAYGMEFSYQKNAAYLKTFWKNRLAALLIPMLVVNVLGAIYEDVETGRFMPESIVALNHYVFILLQYCLAFYIVHLLERHFGWSIKTSDIILLILIIGSSILIYSFASGSDWCYERMGLAWGILLFRYREAVEKIMSGKYLLRTACAIVMAGVLGVAYLKFKTVPFWGEYLLKIGLGVVLVWCAFAVTGRLKISNPVITILGKISYPIYLSHVIIMSFIAYFAPDISSGGFIGLTYVFTIIFSLLVERVTSPCIKYIRSTRWMF